MSIESELRSNAHHTGAIETMELSITPERAYQWLERNANNRPIRMPHIKNLARQMALGRWELSPEPVVFAKSGRLLDGQHRLMAVIESGATIRATVALVENEDVFRVLDQGVNRSNSDIMGIPSQIITPVQYLVSSSVASVKKVTPSDLEPLMDTDLFKYSRRVHEVVKPKHKRFKNAPFKASYIMAIMLGRISPERATQVYSDLSNINTVTWTPVMRTLFSQLENFNGKYSGSGSLRNSFFMRGFYMFENVDTDKSSIMITENYMQNVSSRVKQKVNFIAKTCEASDE